MTKLLSAIPSKAEFMTAEFQATLADMATNERRARLYLGQDVLDMQYNKCKDHLNALSTITCRRIIVLASLLSQRRFKRVVKLLPASRQILGDYFESNWNENLEAVPAGMPCATQEAVDYANFLKKKIQTNQLKKDILHYESCLNEISRRLYQCGKERVGRPLARPLSRKDYVQLSPYVLVEGFSHDVVSAVKKLRAGSVVDNCAESGFQSVIFRPKHCSGLAVDVSIIPNKLKTMLDRASEPVPISFLLDIEMPDFQQSMMPKLDYLLNANVLRICPPMS